jgi:hypothetical protein
LSKVKQYSALRAISNETWNLVKVTTFGEGVTKSDEDSVTEKVTGVTFTENLLRNILDLKPGQQLDFQFPQLPCLAAGAGNVDKLQNMPN